MLGSRLCAFVYWIQVAQSRVHWRAPVNMANEPSYSIKREEEFVD